MQLGARKCRQAALDGAIGASRLSSGWSLEAVASIGFITAVGDEGELDFLNGIRDEDTERSRHQCGVREAEQLGSLTLCCCLVASYNMKRTAAFTLEKRFEAIIAQKGWPTSSFAGPTLSAAGMACSSVRISCPSI